jgi:hypothetical protein
MKAIILSLTLILGITAANHGKPIIKIYSLEEPALTEEAYVNDIPFNTWEIAVEAIFDGDEMQLKEEPYVDDIPFDTKKVACRAMLDQMMESRGEVNIDDIPFSTEKIYCEHIAAILMEKFRNESPVDDLPDESRLLFLNISRLYLAFLVK